MRTNPLDVALTVEELGLSCEVSLGPCSRSTAYRDLRRVNEYLEKNRYDWRVKLITNKETVHPYSLKVIGDHYVLVYYIEDDIVHEEPVLATFYDACDMALAFDCPAFEEAEGDYSAYVAVMDAAQGITLFWTNTEGKSETDYEGDDPEINAALDYFL